MIPKSPSTLLLLSIRKLLLIHSNPAARLSLRLYFNSQAFELPGRYKVLKETQIPDVFRLQLSTPEGVIRLETLLIFANKSRDYNEKLIGKYELNLKDAFEPDGRLIRSEWELRDDTTEKIYQPRLFLLLTIAKTPEFEEVVSPTFNPASPTTFPESKDLPPQKPASYTESPIKVKYKPTFRLAGKRSATPNASVGADKKGDFLKSLAIGYVAMLRKRMPSETPSRERYQEESAVVDEDEAEPKIERVERVKRSHNPLSASPEQKVVAARIEDAELMDKEAGYSLEVYETENYKLATEIAGLAEAMRVENAKAMCDPTEARLLEGANRRLAEEILLRDKDLKARKEELDAVYVRIKGEQDRISSLNEGLEALRGEQRALRTKGSVGLVARYRLEKLGSGEGQAEGQEEEDLGRLEQEIELERAKHERLEGLYQDNIEENENFSGERTETELLRERLRELSEARDSMRKKCFAKDQRLAELEKTSKILGQLIVKANEMKAMMVNAVFERQNADIIDSMDRKSTK